MSKLTDSDVIAIRKSLKTTGELGREYSVSHSNISMIRAGKAWKHLL